MERNSERRYEEEVCEQPVDYSKKYNERKVVAQNHLIENSPRTERSCKKEFRERDSKVDLFGDYAETDLDQPTDYSLRYAEDDTDDDEKQATEYFSGSMQEDTVKTYCTEGTPYETPFNFSTATSMSDLRLEDTKENVDLMKKQTKKAVELSRKESLPFERTLPLNCDNDQSIPIQKESKPPKNDRSRDVTERLTPEKMIDYYQARTPDGFSRANSLSSLGSTNTQRNNIIEIITKAASADSGTKAVAESERTSRCATNCNSGSGETDSPTDGKSHARVVDKEGKMVTFSRQDFYAEQTPLMFSRCSSLGSLSGFEQHSIHDDRSSIVSDFSRRTSGIVSPSELPDSPTQTIPPSPRNHKSQCSDFISKIQEEAVRPSVRHLSFSKSHVTKSSVFEDDIATFKEESTPIEFSTATSLSSLTIDDEVKITDSSKQRSELEETLDDVDKNNKSDVSREKSNNVEVEKDQEQVSDGDEDDEDMLAACISMGMQNNRYRQSFKISTVQKPIQPESSNLLVRCQRPTHLKRLESRITGTTADTPATSQKTNKTGIEVVAAPDTVHIYCTEDTPADISPVGSQSNLSALSMPSVPEDVERIEEGKSASEAECHRNDLSDESSNLSGEDEKILDECIQSGMPKIQQITPPPTGCIPCVQKMEAVTERFNKCGTPSSSPVESSNKNPTLNKSLCRAPVVNELSDDSPNHSDDENILSECIRSAIPKVRANISSLIRPAQSQTVEKPKATNIRKPSTSVSFFQTKYTKQTKHQPKKFVPFDDNLSLSEEEEDIILAQCIKSGMPKAVNVSSSLPSLTMNNRPNQHSKQRNSPGTSSFDLINKCYSTKNITVQALLAQNPAETDVPTSVVDGTSSNNFHRFPVNVSDNNASRMSVKKGDVNVLERTNTRTSSARRLPHTDNEQGNPIEHILSSSRPSVGSCTSPISNIVDNDDEDLSQNIMKPNVVPSRHSSVSSLSEEGSLGSIEEWALLELCISSGMPRNKYRLKAMKTTEGNSTISSNHEDRETIPEDNYSICSYNSYVCKT